MKVGRRAVGYVILIVLGVVLVGLALQKLWVHIGAVWAVDSWL